MRSDRTRKNRSSSSPNVMDVYVSELNRSVSEGSPDTDAYVAVQSAMLGLANRRAEAYAEIYEALARCQSPAELVQEQSRFCTAAIEDYADYSRRFMTAWSEALDFEPFYGGQKTVNSGDTDSSPTDIKLVSTRKKEVPEVVRSTVNASRNVARSESRKGRRERRAQ